MTQETPLIIGSLSKCITATSVMLLVEAGKLDLDTPVQRYLPWFRLADPDGSRQIILRHLLTHTSGISGYDGQASVSGRSEQTIEQRVRTLSTLGLCRPVGTTYEYSNHNYVIAGLLVEVVSGEDFGSSLHHHLLLHWACITAIQQRRLPERMGSRAAYCWWFGVPLPYHASYRQDALPAICLHSWVKARLRVSLLSPVSVRELFRSQVTVMPGSCYGLGWRIETLDGEMCVRHSGAVSNAFADLVLIPELRLG